jgi:hypothetical protein
LETRSLQPLKKWRVRDLARLPRWRKRDLVQRGKGLLTTAVEAETSLGVNAMGLTTQEAVSDFLATAGNAFATAQKANGYGSAVIWMSDIVQRAQSTRGARLNGMDHPPCSATNDKPDLIYDVRLGSDAIRVHDNKLPQVSAKSSEWPTSRIRFDEPVSRQAFVAMTRELFDWSVARQCRFFVRVIDATLAHEKTIYKVQLRAVESHFYKSESLDGYVESKRP